VSTGFGMWEQPGRTLACRGEPDVVGNGDIRGTRDRIQCHDSLQETREAASAVETVPEGTAGETGAANCLGGE
jgi:hypothetical protein